MTTSSLPVQNQFDPSNDVYHYTTSPLKSIFAPLNVAVIGATEKEGSVGRTILWNLISNPFGGAVFPVNPKRPSLLGIKAYPTIKDVPDPVDLAVIVTPAPTIPGIIGVAVTGWLVEATGAYASAFVLAAAINVVGAIIWLLFGTSRRVVD
jgi:hypothetical protein